ncbi:MAG: hypothetical protein U0Q04_04215 [Microbacterium sp.]
MGHISLNPDQASARAAQQAWNSMGWAGLALLVIVLFFVFVIALGASSGALRGLILAEPRVRARAGRRRLVA